MILSRRIEQAFARHNDKAALSHCLPGGTLQTLTYGMLARKVKEVADFFAREGMQPNDLVASYMNKSIDAAVTILGAILAGGAACSLNSRLKPSHIIRLARVAKPKFIILNRSTVKQIMSSEDAITSNLRFALWNDGIEFLNCIPARGAQESRQSGAFAAIDGMSDPRINVPFSNSQKKRGYCLFTSGSTGEQKGVLIDRDDLYVRVSTEIEDFEITREDCLLSLLPFSFDVGLNQLFSSILSGAHLIILNSWFPRDIATAIKRFSISGISAVPTIWADMLSVPQENDFSEDTKTLRYITVSGGDLARKYLEQLKHYFPKTKIIKTYGQSETFRSGILKANDYDAKMTSVGRPVKGTRIFILKDTTQIASPDEEGEIIHYGAGTMLGYINEVAGSQKKIAEIPACLKPTISAGKVVFTGDRGKIDRDGFLYVLGREDGMIKSSGFRIYPKEVESCILEHPGVTHCAVVGIPDNRKGHSIIAEIISHEGLEKEDLIRHMKERLPSYMVPDDINIVKSLPLAENGKIRYAEIKNKYEQARILQANTKI